MKQVCIDESGELRCWKCGSKNLETRRTSGGKFFGAAVGIVALGPLGAAGALAAKKRIRCQGCGQYNETGNPQKWVPPKQPFDTSKLKPVKPASRLARRS